MSEPRTFHGWDATSCGRRVSGWCDLRWVWQVGHSLTSSSMSLFIRYQYTQVQARSLHFLEPWCPVWMPDSISCRMDVGTMMRSPLVTSPSSTDSSSLMSQYGLKGSGTSWHLSGQPVVTISRSAGRVTSFRVSSRRVLCFLGENWTKQIFLSSSISSDWRLGRWERPSAKRSSLPGLYLICRL